MRLGLRVQLGQNCRFNCGQAEPEFRVNLNLGSQGQLYLASDSEAAAKKRPCPICLEDSFIPMSAERGVFRSVCTFCLMCKRIQL